MLRARFILICLDFLAVSLQLTMSEKIPTTSEGDPPQCPSASQTQPSTDNDDGDGGDDETPETAPSVPLPDHQSTEEDPGMVPLSLDEGEDEALDTFAGT